MKKQAITCGDIKDFRPETPGKVTEICAREPHSPTTWHHNKAKSVQWRYPKKRIQSKE